MSQPSDSQLRRYLLRQLSDAEAEAIETAYFGDSTLAARIEDLDDDLARAYVGGSLDAVERTAFERGLKMPRRAARMAFIAGISAATVQPRATGPATPGRRDPWTAWTALAAAAVVLGPRGGWWLMAPGQRVGPGRQAEAPPPMLAPTVTTPPARVARGTP